MRPGSTESGQYHRSAVALSPASWRVFWRRFLTASLVSLVVIVASIVYLNQQVSAKLRATKKVTLTFPEGSAEGGNYLIIGSDSRDFVQDAGQAQAFGTNADAGGKRSDTMMVLHLDPATKTSLLVSFPRDLLVDIPGHGLGQINSAFNDGPQKVVDTLKANFDLDVNHYVEVDFAAFVSVVNAVDKIPVYFPQPARDKFSGLNIPYAGCIALDGDGALSYVRSRHLQTLDEQTGRWRDASPRADLDRIQRQQDFIRKLAARASAKAGENPLTAIDIADAVVSQLTVDEQLSQDDILRLVKTFRNVDPTQSGALEMETLPVEESTAQAGRLVAKQPEAEQLLARLRASDTPTPASSEKVRPVDVTVGVLNGSGVDGAAGKALGLLQERAFAPGTPGNTAITDTTLVRYGPNNEAKAELVSRYLGGVGKLVADPSLGDVDVIVVIGKDWRGIHGRDKAAKPAPTTTTTAAKGSGGKKPTTTTAAAGPAC